MSILAVSAAPNELRLAVVELDYVSPQSFTNESEQFSDFGAGQRFGLVGPEDPGLREYPQTPAWGGLSPDRRFGQHVLLIHLHGIRVFFTLMV